MDTVVVTGRPLYLLDWIGKNIFVGSPEQTRYRALRLALAINRDIHRNCTIGVANPVNGLLFRVDAESEPYELSGTGMDFSRELGLSDLDFSGRQASIPDFLPDDIETYKPTIENVKYTNEGPKKDVNPHYIQPGEIIPIFPIDRGDHVSFNSLCQDVVDGFKTPPGYEHKRQEVGLDKKVVGSALSVLRRHYTNVFDMFDGCVEISTAVLFLEKRGRELLKNSGRFFYYPVQYLEGIDEDEALVLGKPIRFADVKP